jgi:hypothetical protein
VDTVRCSVADTVRCSVADAVRCSVVDAVNHALDTRCARRIH